MIRTKSKKELEVLRAGGRKLAAILNYLCNMVQPGVTTGELESEALRLFAEAGGRPAFKGYPMPDGESFPTALITCINGEVVHAPSLPPRPLRDGDLIKIDLGMEYPLTPVPSWPANPYSHTNGFFTDMARTVLVGEAGEVAGKLVQITRDCLYAGIKAAQPGNTLNQIGRAVQGLAEANGFSVVRELVGHGVGHMMHEDPQVPNFDISDKSLRDYTLKPGMVIAIEPMINAGGWQVKTADDGFTIVTADGSLSAHFEHTVAITEEGPLILTAE